jgi:hypothetical protein
MINQSMVISPFASPMIKQLMVMSQFADICKKQGPTEHIQITSADPAQAP